jgi:queuine tRNA-ribosyltransferase
MHSVRFTIREKDGNARTGIVETPHGNFETPAFIAVGTKATIKSITPEQVREAGIDVVLGNTYHLYLQPGKDIVAAHGGFAPMMGWKGPSVTDSGGFQVFSLGTAYGKGISKILHKDQPEELILNAPQSTVGEKDGEDAGASLVKIDHDGVMFRSHIDGSAHYFTPEKSIEIQHALGADIFFAFDECTSPHEPQAYQHEAMDRTHRWAKRSLDFHRSSVSADKQAIFGVIQGGRYESLRKESAQKIADMGFDGVGIGGSFAKDDMSSAVRWVTEVLPEHLPRHLLGIGEPEDIFMAVESGIDMFDCVAPTRMARNGTVYSKRGRLNLNNAMHAQRMEPIELGCDCYTCKNFTTSYVAHLFKAKEMLAASLATIHNLHFMAELFKNIRKAIKEGGFDEYKREFLSGYYR